MTEGDITKALYGRYCAPEWAFFSQVANRTGGCGRYADGIAMNLYPSRGLALYGFEIKVSRSDMKSELKNPDKAEEIARFCNCWYLVTPAGLVRPEDEIPLGWGVLEVSPEMTIRQKKAAETRTPQPITKDFVASILRRANESEKLQFEQNIEKTVESRIAGKIDHALTMRKHDIDRLERENSRLHERISEFEKSSGISLSGYEMPKKIGDAVNLLIKLNITGTFGLLEMIRRDNQKISEALTAIGQFIGEESDPAP